MILKKIKNKIRQFDEFKSYNHKALELSRVMNADILAMTQLNGLLNGEYLPITEYSLRPYTIVHILNEILINNRKTIVEFGSGISTIAISYLIKQKGLNVKLLSFDHDDKWQEAINYKYIKENSGEIEMVHAPLSTTTNGINEGQRWYDEGIIHNKLKNQKIDMIIIDGPLGGLNKFARYPAISIVKKYLDKNGLVVVDDITRPDEKRIVEDLISEGFLSNWSFRHCMLTKLISYNTNPLGRV